MRDVVEAKWESSPRYLGQKKGWGSQVRWECQLSCGHTTTRYDRSGEVTKPKRARCEKCGGGITPV